MYLGRIPDHINILRSVFDSSKGMIRRWHFWRFSKSVWIIPVTYPGTNDEGKGKTDAGPALGTRRSTTPPNPRSSAGMSPHSFTPNHRTTTGHHSSAASNGRTTPPHNPSRCHKNCAHSQIDAMVTVRNQIFTFQGIHKGYMYVLL